MPVLYTTDLVEFVCDECVDILMHSHQQSDVTADVSFLFNYTASSVVNIILLTDEYCQLWQS